VTEQSGDSYLTPEGKARREIDAQLTAAGWVIQDYRAIDLYAKGEGSGVAGVAVREVPLVSGHGVADYLLFVDQVAVGVLEAKKQGMPLVGVETQSGKYSQGLPEQLTAPVRPLPFVYESTGAETRFTNLLDPVPRSREVHWFHRPDTLAGCLAKATAAPAQPTFRGALRQLPALERTGLRAAQFDAITALETSLGQNRTRALIQMATGAGKTFTAANECYRLLKHANSGRLLFIVDRGNLGRQALKEFQTFITPDTGKKFTDLYNVQLLKSPTIDPAADIVITTIQRLFSILSGTELAEEDDERSLEELENVPVAEVTYNAAVPIEFFDLIVIDEAHRSIYGTWRQVLEYFDCFLVGLTATPSKQTLGFFQQNLVFSYTHEQAVADKVNVDFDVYRIRTAIGENGSVIEADGETLVKFRDRLSGQTRLVALKDDYAYAGKDLDRAVVAEDQLRTVIRTFRDKLFTEIFPGRSEVPKTLVFAKDDAHADRIVQMLREEFDRANEFAVKITYKTTGRKAEDLLSDFRNSYHPRIAVTVDMIATGTDVKPLECVMFLRGVKSRNFFEQMKGRGVRVIGDADFRQVTPDATSKTHFVIVDAVGVTETELNETTPLDREPAVALGTLLQQASLGITTSDLASSLGSRLIRLDKQLSADDKADLAQTTGGVSLSDLARALITAVNPDQALAAAQATVTAEGRDDEPTDAEIATARDVLVKAALKPIASNPALRQKLLDARSSVEQVIDEVSQDSLVEAGFSKDAKDRAHKVTADFRWWLQERRDEIAAIEILYSVPHKRRLQWAELKELSKAISRPPHQWTPDALWEAYEQLDASRVRGAGTKRMTTDLVSLVRFALDVANELVPFQETVAERFAGWVSAQEQQGRTFTSAQMEWLERIRDVIAAGLTVGVDDFEASPLVERGGLGGATAVLGKDLPSLLDELNEVLAA
jgi:type I restriction enzyme R subunit